MTVEEIISTAGRRNLTVKIGVESQKGQLQEFEVEAYGRKQRGALQFLFCLDVRSFEYKNIDLSLVRSAQMTHRMFKPRFPIDF